MQQQHQKVPKPAMTGPILIPQTSNTATLPKNN